MAIDWDKKFKPEYDKAREQIAKNTRFAPEWKDLIRKLESLMGSDGFNAAHENALKDLQTRLREEKNREKITEDEGILKAINLWPLADTATLQGDKKKQAACLKLLRHIYLQNKYGNSIVWVFNLPDDFTTSGPARKLPRHRPPQPSNNCSKATTNIFPTSSDDTLAMPHSKPLHGVKKRI